MASWADLGTSEREVFEARHEALWADVVRPVTALYGDDPQILSDTLAALEALAREAYAARPTPLRLLDVRRLSTPDWHQQPTMLGYVCYTDRFAGTLHRLAHEPRHLELLEELGVTYLHLMPLLAPRPGPNDGGYAVADYGAVDPRLGTMDDLREVATTLRRKGINLVVDLVCNHTAREHRWAQAAIAGEPAYSGFYLTYPDRTEPDRWERTLPEIFPDFAPGNFTWVPQMLAPGESGDDEPRGRWVWTTFNNYQWDLNYANPRVLVEMTRVILDLAAAGVEVVRLDAVAFMWKRLGTNCQNQPEAHAILQAFRAVTRIVAPSLILLAEAIVSPDDLVPYLGVGEATNKECELAYHNVLMVSLWSALAEGNVRLLTSTIGSMPPISSGASWLTYARLHDDIGWAVTDDNAAAVGLNGFRHRSFLSDYYSGQHPGSPARGLVFQENPVTRDRRISGSLASFAGLEAALESGDARQVDLAVARILLLHTVILGFGGVPLVYMGDELGLGNDYSFAQDPDHADDNRWVHRPVMDWAAAERRHTPGTVEQRIFAGIAQVAAIRARTLALHAQAASTPVWLGNDAVFGLLRSSSRGRLLLLANVTALTQAVDVVRLGESGPGDGSLDLLTGERLGGWVPLAPYQVRWLVADTR